MTILEAIQARHSVRKYTDCPIPEETLVTLRNKVWEINRESGLNIQLVSEEPKAFKGLFISSYGQFSGVRNYLVMAGPKGKDMEEKTGYFGEELVLLAQTLGLNSCWVGLTYKKIPGAFTLREGDAVHCVIAIGFGESQGSGHQVKSVSDVSNASDLTPEWFRKGVEAALLAPTAVNQQKFRFEYLGFKDGGKRPKVSAKSLFTIIGYGRIDLGIAKYHFELGAGKENFEWA